MRVTFRQSVGTPKGGWYSMTREACTDASNPPFADEWVCIWVLQFSWELLQSPTHCLEGAGWVVVRTAVEYGEHDWRLEHYPQDLLERVRSHCLMCGGMVLCQQSLQMHIRLNTLNSLCASQVPSRAGISRADVPSLRRMWSARLQAVGVRASMHGCSQFEPWR